MNRLCHYWALILAIAILLSMIALHWTFTVDDAYISARYAEHIAAGLGARFNAGDPPVEGFTSPLAVMIQAFGVRLGASPVIMGKLLGVFGALLTVGLLRWFVSRSDKSADALSPYSIACLLPVCIPQLAVHAVSGLETTLFTALLLAAIAMASRLLAMDQSQRYRSFAFVSLLLGLARPEGNLAAAGLWVVVLLHAKDQRRRLFFAMILYYIMPAAIYFVLRWAYFGLPLPLPFYVKASAATMFQGLPTVVRFFLWSAAYLGLPFLFGALRAPSEITRAVMAGTLPLAVFFLWPEHIMGFGFRFLFPIVPALCAVAAFGIDPLAAFIYRALPQRWSMSQRRLRLAIVICMTVGMSLTTFRTFGYYNGYGAGLRRAHIRLGKDLAGANSADRTPTIVTADSGAIPFYSGFRALDSFGLNMPSIALHPERGRASLLDENPEFLVVLSMTADHFVPRLRWEQALYDTALAKGYRVKRRYEFRNDYFLLLMVSPSLSVEGLPAT